MNFFPMSKPMILEWINGNLLLLCQQRDLVLLLLLLMVRYMLLEGVVVARQ